MAWPVDPPGGEPATVPARFGQATNEVLLTRAGDFDARFRAHMVSAVPKDDRDWAKSGDNAEFLGARRAVIGMVVEGQWAAPQGPAAPGGLIKQTNEAWYSRGLLDVPGTSERKTPNSATFVVHTQPPEVLERARMFVSRRGESFDDFCRVSLADYVAGRGRDGGGMSGRSAREREVVDAFSQALTLALPLAGVSGEVVKKLYGSDPSFRYKFSEVPFGDDPLAEQLAGVLNQKGVDGAIAKENLSAVLATNSEVTRVHIFGSYPVYSPLVFRGILEPAADQWAKESRSREFWKFRRARPLAAALPMGDRERLAMVKGWLVGQLLGQLRVPDKPPFDDLVRIWDPEAKDWVHFPDPLLTPPSTFSVNYDWLPAVLESMVVAVAQAPKFPVLSSLKPYQLLRDLFGENVDAPEDGGIIPPQCENLLRDWLRSGRTLSGSTGRVVADSPEERAKKAIDWLTAVKSIAAQYVPGGDKSTAPSALVKTRAQACKAPLFRDLADDFATAASDLARLVGELEGQLAEESDTPEERDDDPTYQPPSPESSF